MPRRRLRACIAGAVVLLSTACRSYTPVPSTDLRPGATARVRLTDRGSVDLASVLGPRGSTIEGRVVRAEDSVLVLAVQEVTRMNGIEETWGGETVNIASHDMAAVDLPRLSRTRSALLAGAVAAGLVALAAVFSGGDFLGGGGGGGTNSPK